MSSMRRSPLPTVFRYENRSEEHTSELQSHSDLVCRLLLEKKRAHTWRTNAQSHLLGAIAHHRGVMIDLRHARCRCPESRLRIHKSPHADVLPQHDKRHTLSHYR